MHVQSAVSNFTLESDTLKMSPFSLFGKFRDFEVNTPKAGRHSEVRCVILHRFLKKKKTPTKSIKVAVTHKRFNTPVKLVELKLTFCTSITCCLVDLKSTYGVT